jgi:hypothetical protein
MRPLVQELENSLLLYMTYILIIVEVNLTIFSRKLAPQLSDKIDA